MSIDGDQVFGKLRNESGVHVCVKCYDREQVESTTSASHRITRSTAYQYSHDRGPSSALVD